MTTPSPDSGSVLVVHPATLGQVAAALAGEGLSIGRRCDLDAPDTGGSAGRTSAVLGLLGASSAAVAADVRRLGRRLDGFVQDATSTDHRVGAMLLDLGASLS